jgi:hypothetical protein
VRQRDAPGDVHAVGGSGLAQLGTTYSAWLLLVRQRAAPALAVCSAARCGGAVAGDFRHGGLVRWSRTEKRERSWRRQEKENGEEVRETLVA